MIGGAPDIGQERYAEDLRRSAEALPVQWLGQVTADDFLPGLDAFALVAEPAGCPNASLEAMAHGLAVVATDAGGMNDQVVDGVAGRLVPRGDSWPGRRAGGLDGGAAAVRRDGPRRPQRAQKFSLDRMADRYMRLLGLAASPA